jgi:argininosuccinate lyase
LLPDLIKSIKVDTKRSNKFIDQDMLMTDQAYELVQSGLPFREAYIKVKSQQETSVISKTLSRKNSSSGSAYNLDLKTLKTRLKKLDKSK